MAVISNIHVGITAWASGQTIAIGARRSNAAKAYQATTAGTTGATAPTHTTGAVSDGAVTWQYLSAIDYTTIAAWIAGIPATLTDAVEGRIWNNGELTFAGGFETSAGIVISGKTTTATFTITLRAAPGESFSDNPSRLTNALAYDPAKGVAIRMTGTGAYVQLIHVASANVTLHGLQLKSGSSGNYHNLIECKGAIGAVVLDKVILDGIAAGGAAGGLASVEGGGPYLVMRNCLVVDRQASGGTSPAIVTAHSSNSAATSLGRLTNCTVVGINSPAAGVGAQAMFESFAAKNCLFMGHGVPVKRDVGSAAVTVTTCVCSAASLGTEGSGTGNLFSKLAANQFENATTDFRLKAGNDCGTGTPDTVLLPSSDDIYGQARS